MKRKTESFVSALPKPSGASHLPLCLPAPLALERVTLTRTSVPLSAWPVTDNEAQEAAFQTWCDTFFNPEALAATHEPGDLEILFAIALPHQQLYLGYKDEIAFPDFDELDRKFILGLVQQQLTEMPYFDWILKHAKGGVDVDYFDAKNRLILSFHIDAKKRVVSHCVERAQS